MKWHKIIPELQSKFTTYELDTPLRDASIIAAAFNVQLPQELINLYNETNGIQELMDGEVIGYLIWSVERVIKDNTDFRTDETYKEIYQPFDTLLFFADAGNGDNFGYAIEDNKIKKTDIYAWNHEDDSRTWVAPDLETFVQWSVSGKITT
jgi:hypothetical protein